MTDLKSETPQARARRLMDEIDQAKGTKQSYTFGDVKIILNNIANMSPERLIEREDVEDKRGCRDTTTLSRISRGDVFIAKTWGGKVRPWVCLRVLGDEVVAVAMSTGAYPGNEPSQSRFWPVSHIGGATCTFSMEDATAEVTRPYSNHKHLSEVEARLLDRHRPRRLARVTKLREVKSA